ncbi:MAG: DUF6291 domain-containing protein [Christensenellales bacterium]
MKEKYFKVTESIADSVQSMDDRTAGKFIKAVCDYAFKGKAYDGKDTVIKSNFILVKRVLDGQAQDIAYGKLGAKKSMEIRRNEKEAGGMCVGRVVVGGGDVGDFLKDLLSTLGGDDNEDGK